MSFAPPEDPTQVYADTPQSGESRPSRDEDDPGLPRYIGRFYILKRIGRGGMGQVLLGYDEDLGRKVAIKLLRGQSGERDRILREAQALAQLSHPNVTQVYEVGECGDVGETVYLAMEFVAGDLLRAWCKGKRREEILAAYVQAGHGLAAAHRAGMVHRDFKPNNVIVGRDGRVRVMDFGLARGALQARDPKEQTVVRAAKSVLWEEMTQVGSIMGTPAYMAPEQWTSGPIDPRTDQFAFCVSLWEALCGDRPFAGRTPVTLKLKITTGARRDTPASAKIPGWLRRVLIRGMSLQPGQRWPGMPELLHALETGERNRRIRAAAVVLAVAAAVVLAVASYRQREADAHAASCHAAGRSIAEAWNPTIQAQVRAAFIAAAPDYGAAAFDRAGAFLDEFTARWTTARAHACMLPRFDPRWTPEVASRADECLVAARWALESSVAALAAADAGAVQRAVQVAADLPAVAPCLDVGWLSRRPYVLSPDVAPAEAARLRRELHAIRSMHAAGRYAGARERARALLTYADEGGLSTIAAEARLVAGALAAAMSDVAEAERLYEDGFMIAAEADEATLMADAATRLSSLVGGAPGRAADSLRWGRLAQALVTAQGEMDGLRGARVLANLAGVHEDRGELDEALQMHEQALAIRAQVLGPEHPDVALSLAAIGAVYRARGQIAEAREMFKRMLGLSERVLGPEHPEVAGALSALGGVAIDIGDVAEAQQLSARALQIRERALPAGDPLIAESLSNLGAAYMMGDERAKAQPLFERALGIMAQVHGADHPRLVIALGNLGHLYIGRRDWDGAKKAFTRALAIVEKAYGPDHVEAAFAHGGLGDVAAARGREAEAIRRYERALQIFEGKALPLDTARARFILAQALAGSAKERARELATAARAVFRELGQGQDLAGVEAWLSRADEPAPAPSKRGKKKKGTKKRKT